MKYLTLHLALTAILLTSPLHAQVPKLLNYQGRVAVGSVNFEGAGQFRFALVNNTGATTFWSNGGTSVAGSQPANAVSLTVGKGLYSVLLGDVALANMTAIPASVFTHPDVRLRVWFNDGVNGSQLLTPDQRIAPTPYLADGAVTSAAITPGAITGTHVAPGSLDFSHLTVPAAPGAGQVLSFDGASLNWITAGASDGIWALHDADAFYNAGKVGIGTSSPLTALEVRTGSGLYGLLHSDGNIQVASYVGGSASGATGGWLGTRSNHALHLYVNGGQPSLTINPGGSVSMSGGSPGFVSVGTPNAETGITIQRSGGRSDLRFDGTTVKLYAGADGVPPGPANGLSVRTNGRVGIGTENPVSKVEIVSQDALAMTGSQPFLTLRDSSAGNARGRIQSAGGNIILATESYIAGNGNNYALLNANGSFSVKTLTIRGGADLAEPFAMSERGVPAGTVVSIDPAHPGKLRRSAAAYDRKVAGIVSGANGIHPGISMIQEDALEAGENVALSGRVFVKANASAGVIAPGDLLTTSGIPGEAMKAADHDRAQGSILGKAMTAFDETTGLVLVLVTLQ